MEFCKAFNAETQGAEPGLPIPVVITVFADRSFTFITKTPPASVLLRKAAGIKKGSGRPNTEKVGKVSRAQLEEIATQKMSDLTAADMDAAVRTLADSARSAGLEVETSNGLKLSKKQKAIAEKLDSGKPTPMDEAVSLIAELPLPSLKSRLMFL